MLERVDRMLLAVNDRAQATQTFERLLGAQPLRQFHSRHLNADVAVLALGESELELCQPAGDGPVAQQLAQRGEGLLAAGYATSQLDALTQRLAAQQVPLVSDDGRLYLPASSTAGFPMVISTLQPRPRVGPISFFYEATNTLQTDWRTVQQRYVTMFGLDASRFSPISSKLFGYEGTLTLFDPAHRLDRIELSQTFADRPGAMRRFVEKHGDSLYMCYVEAHDFDRLRDRLLAAGAGLTARGASIADEQDGLWVHPRSLHGMLLGVSRTGFAWIWSGQPERVPAR